MRLPPSVRGFPPPVPSLDGRLCLVADAVSGIAARRRARRRKGARLVLTDVNAEELAAVAGELGSAPSRTGRSTSPTWTRSVAWPTKSMPRTGRWTW